MMCDDSYRSPRDSNAFSWQERMGEVKISWKGKVVTVLRRESALKFLEKISTADKKESQLIMAKATGNFKRGNDTIILLEH